METQSERAAANRETACEHCGGLVYGDTVKCPHCGRFPTRLHRCSKCGCIAPANEVRCWKCQHPFKPDGDYL